MNSFLKTGYLNEGFRIFHLYDVPDKDFQFHYHDFHKLLLFLKGDIIYSIEGKNYELQPYDILLIREGEIHRPMVNSPLPYERIIIYISPEFLNDFSTDNYDPAYCFNMAKKNHSHLIRIASFEKSRIYIFLRELENALKEELYGGNVYQSLLFQSLLVLINQGIYEKRLSYISSYVYHEKIAEILDYIQLNLTDELSIDFLSKQFFLSKYHLMHLFKKETGTTLASYIVKKRLVYGRELIEKQTPVTEACYMCGFKNYSTFYRAFIKEFGHRPGDTEKI